MSTTSSPHFPIFFAYTVRSREDPAKLPWQLFSLFITKEDNDQIDVVSARNAFIPKLVSEIISGSAIEQYLIDYLI